MNEVIFSKSAYKKRFPGAVALINGLIETNLMERNQEVIDAIISGTEIDEIKLLSVLRKLENVYENL